MKARGKWLQFLMPVVLLATGTLSVWGQEATADNMDVLRETLRAEKKLVIAQNMQLSESEAKAFWPVYERYQNDLGRIYDRTLALIQEYADNYDSMNDAVAQKLLDDLLTLEEDRLKLMRSYVPEFKKVLPATKVARYFQIENKIRAVINYDLAANIPVIQ